MNTTPPNPWIHIGECTFCVNGICRVRCCTAVEDEKHLFAVCDECEAIWIEPDTGSEKHFPDPESATCPICPAPLYGDQSRWALAEDLAGTPWETQVIYSVPSSDLDEPSEKVTPSDHSNAPRPRVQAIDNFVDPEDEATPGC